MLVLENQKKIIYYFILQLKSPYIQSYEIQMIYEYFEGDFGHRGGGQSHLTKLRNFGVTWPQFQGFKMLCQACLSGLICLLLLI